MPMQASGSAERSKGAHRPGLEHLVVAIDGTAGSGKSTASRGVAQRLGLRYLDTGAMYRAVAWQMLLDGIDPSDPEPVAARAETVRIESDTDPRAPGIRLDGVDVAREIRLPEVDVAVSPVSAVPRVREIVVAQQQDIIDSGGIVVEGRDIGTVVAPHAQLKVYLFADPSARARRRAAEALGGERDVTIVQADLLRRDDHDSTRVASPLKPADDAVLLDTTALTLAEVVDQIVALAKERAGA